MLLVNREDLLAGSPCFHFAGPLVTGRHLSMKIEDKSKERPNSRCDKNSWYTLKRSFYLKSTFVLFSDELKKLFSEKCCQHTLVFNTSFDKALFLFNSFIIPFRQEKRSDLKKTFNHHSSLPAEEEKRTVLIFSHLKLLKQIDH